MSDTSLDTATIDRILGLAPANLLDVDGFTYIDKDKTVTLFQPPVPKLLPVSTLTGFVDLLENNFEGYPVADTLVHVAAHDRVELIARASDSYGRRQVYIQAVAQKVEREFTFNQYMPQEQFVIALRSLFLPNEAVDALIAVAGNLAMKAQVKQEDDGFTQRVTSKAGVTRLGERTITPRVTLTPYRTFREAEQPASDYIFRVKGDEETATSCALFEADGGTWKLMAIQNVKTWITNRIRTSVIVPELSEMPVIA